MADCRGQTNSGSPCRNFKHYSVSGMRYVCRQSSGWRLRSWNGSGSGLLLVAEADAPLDVRLLRRELKAFLETKDDRGHRIGSHKYGIYAFYDYDGEPIYVGQTSESLGTRIRRHLTNQRTDAVAMSVLDPFEVSEVEAWPVHSDEPGFGTDFLDRAEYTVFQDLLGRSTFSAVLNEAPMKPSIAGSPDSIDLSPEPPKITPL